MWSAKILLLSLLLPLAAFATQPQKAPRKGFFLAVAHRHRNESKPGKEADKGEQEKEIAEEEDALKEKDGAEKKPPADDEAQQAPKEESEDSNLAKANETTPPPTEGEQGNETGNDTAAEGNETRVLNETETEEAQAAWNNWYNKRSEAMWGKCEAMPVCVKLCRWIRLAFVIAHGDEKTAFKDMDKDGDGKVSSEEFVNAAVAAGVTDDKLAVTGYAILYVIDINEDGFVSEQNFEKLVSVAKEGDRKAAEAEAKEAAAADEEGKSGDGKKEIAEIKETKALTPEEEFAALKKDVESHEDELGREFGNEFKELKQDHPAPTHYPPPETFGDGGYEYHEPPVVHTEETPTAFPPAAQEPHHEPAKSLCRRSTRAGVHSLVAATLAMAFIS